MTTALFYFVHDKNTAGSAFTMDFESFSLVLIWPISVVDIFRCILCHRFPIVFWPLLLTIFSAPVKTSRTIFRERLVIAVNMFIKKHFSNKYIKIDFLKLLHKNCNHIGRLTENLEFLETCNRSFGKEKHPPGNNRCDQLPSQLCRPKWYYLRSWNSTKEPTASKGPESRI